YARDRATRAHGFFATSGVFFFRFLRLAAVQWIVYAFLFGWMHPWLFDRLYPRMTHETSVERTAFVARVALYLVFGVLLAAATMIFHYAKVRAVVADRRSLIGGTTRARGLTRPNSARARRIPFHPSRPLLGSRRTVRIAPNHRGRPASDRGGASRSGSICRDLRTVRRPNLCLRPSPNREPGRRRRHHVAGVRAGAWRD